MSSQFPAVQGGGSLIIAWQVKGKRVLVVGGGEVAAGRILHCLNADAAVTVVAPSSGLSPEVAFRIAEGQVAHVDRTFEADDLDGVDMALVAVDDPEASTAIWHLCRERRIQANIADVPAECDFYFGSVHRDGPVQLMVSTNGRGPRLAAALRAHAASSLPPNAAAAVEAAGRLRARLRREAPRPEDSSRRMAWVSRVSDEYAWDDLAALSDEDLDNLLRFYAADEVPSPGRLQSMRENRQDI